MGISPYQVLVIEYLVGQTTGDHVRRCAAAITHDRVTQYSTAVPKVGQESIVKETLFHRPFPGRDARPKDKVVFPAGRLFGAWQ